MVRLPAPGPSITMLLLRLGKIAVRLMAPVNKIVIVSSPFPAPQSPVAVSVLADVMASGRVHRSIIVRVAGLGVPRVALVGLLKVKFATKLPSPITRSLIIGTVKLWLVTPGLKVSVPLVGTYSLPAAAVPLLMA